MLSDATRDLEKWSSCRSNCEPNSQINLPLRARLPPLSTLRAFEAVARLGSVSRAAEELGRTHGAVSKQLRALHEEVGLSLFDKAGTGIAPNATGRMLAAAVGDALDQLAGRFTEIVRDARSPVVHVACSASFAMGWLVPHLPEFSAEHPDIRIRLSMTSAREMRNERDADLVVLWDRSAYPPEDQARAIRLADSAFGIVAAPHYAVRRSAKMLSAACQILHEHTSRAWDRWTAQTGVRVEAPTTISFPHTHLCIGAAVAGMGIAIAERRLAEGDLKAGRLVEVAAFAPFADGFAAIPNGHKPISAETGQFLEWLRAALES
ncbi:HTH-type transcriptional regulator TrpI [Alphaproteobacteria bacterium SO-S41]|nr:HTH-type transcriptional regulator TrpI [Alphaproteobacteria bacterium SO-S41]